MTPATVREPQRASPRACSRSRTCCPRRASEPRRAQRPEREWPPVSPRRAVRPVPGHSQAPHAGRSRARVARVLPRERRQPRAPGGSPPRAASRPSGGRSGRPASSRGRSRSAASSRPPCPSPSEPVRDRSASLRAWKARPRQKAWHPDRPQPAPMQPRHARAPAQPMRPASQERRPRRRARFRVPWWPREPGQPRPAGRRAWPRTSPPVPERVPSSSRPPRPEARKHPILLAFLPSSRRLERRAERGAPRAAARRGQSAGGATGGRRRPRGGENAGTCALAEANRPGMRQIAGKRQYRGPGDPTRNRPSSAFGFRPFGRLRTGFRLSERPRGPSHEPGRPAATARARCRRRARLGGRRFLAPGGSGVRLRRAMRVRLQVASAALAPTLRAAGGRA